MDTGRIPNVFLNIFNFPKKDFGGHLPLAFLEEHSEYKTLSIFQINLKNKLLFSGLCSRLIRKISSFLLIAIYYHYYGMCYFRVNMQLVIISKQMKVAFHDNLTFLTWIH